MHILYANVTMKENEIMNLIGRKEGTWDRFGARKKKIA